MLLSSGQWLSKEKICFSPLIIFSALPFILIWGMSAIAILFVIIPFVGDGAASAQHLLILVLGWSPLNIACHYRIVMLGRVHMAISLKNLKILRW